jgi:hypothetical protein
MSGSLGVGDDVGVSGHQGGGGGHSTPTPANETKRAVASQTRLVGQGQVKLQPGGFDRYVTTLAGDVYDAGRWQVKYNPAVCWWCVAKHAITKPGETADTYTGLVTGPLSAATHPGRTWNGIQARYTPTPEGAAHATEDIALLLVGGGAAARGALAAKAAVRGATGAESSLSGALLREDLRPTEKYGSRGVRELENGHRRYYGELRPSRTPGEIAGQRTVREWDPATGAQRTWLQTLDHQGRVRIVRPESGGPRTPYYFDADGSYGGSR